jgi:beta-glucanase (GH16 family)
MNAHDLAVIGRIILFGAPLLAAGVPVLAQNPLIDSNNTQGWTLRPALSDEFNGTSLNTAKWKYLPTWSPFWRWSASRVSLNAGKLNLTMAYRAANEIDQSPIGWLEWSNLNSDKTDQFSGSYVTTEQKRSGSSCLVHFRPYFYRGSTNATISNLPDGTYTFSAWVWSSGGQTLAQMKAKNYGGADKTLNIPQSSGWSEYSIANIQVSNGQCTLVFLSESAGNNWMRIDDVTFKRAGSTTNYAPNPGFENRSTSYYESGGISSITTVKFGCFEARIKPALTPGTAASFWAFRVTSTEWTELDFPEGIYDGYWRSSAHSFYSPDNSTHLVYPVDHAADVSGWHTYTLVWDANSIKFYFDGVLKRTIQNTLWQDQALNIILSLGLRPPYQENPSPSGFPTTMQVDYVRIWQK